MSDPTPMRSRGEPAGGGAPPARGRMMEVQPTGLHQRVPVFLGSKAEVEAAVGYHQRHDSANA